MWGVPGGREGARPYLPVAVSGASLQVLADALPVFDELPYLGQHPGPQLHQLALLLISQVQQLLQQHMI